MRDIQTPPAHAKNPRSGADALRVRRIISKVNLYSCTETLRTAVEKNNSPAPSMDITTGRANADQKVLPVDQVTQLVDMQMRRNCIKEFSLLCTQFHARTTVLFYVHRLAHKSLLRPVPTQPILTLPVDDKTHWTMSYPHLSAGPHRQRNVMKNIATNSEFHLKTLKWNDQANHSQ